jgi:transcriptional regulator with XRE-family HTH domain
LKRAGATIDDRRMSGDLASTVRDGRRSLQVTQAELARRAGISPSYLSRIESASWERGGPWPADGVLVALARAIGPSSTELIGLRSRARSAMRRESGQPDALARAQGRQPYAVSVGDGDVDAAARRLIDRNPRQGTLRSVHVSTAAGRPSGDEPPSTYVDALADRLAAAGETLLYRVCAPSRHQRDPVRAPVDRWSAPNVRARVAFANPLVMDVLIGEHEALIALPDHRGHPHLGACVVVDDPDFVDAIRRWYDQWVWEPPGDGLPDESAAGGPS